MKKIENWNEISENSSLPIGAYACRILSVEDVEEKEYLKIEFDIIKGDYKNYFKDTMERFGLDEWPNSGIIRRSYKKTALSFFKKFITVIEKSNPGFNWNFDETKLVGKVLAIVFDEETWVNDEGQEKKTVKPVDERSIQALMEGRIDTSQKKVESKPTTTTETKVEPKPKSEPESKNKPQPFEEETFTVDEDDLPF